LKIGGTIADSRDRSFRRRVSAMIGLPPMAPDLTVLEHVMLVAASWASDTHEPSVSTYGVIDELGLELRFDAGTGFNEHAGEAFLEQELELLRAKVSESPRHLRVLEERLTEAQTRVATLNDRNERLAETLGAPVIKALLGKAVLPDDSPYTTGGIGLLGTRPSQEAMEGCDTLLIVGSSFPYVEFYPKPDQAKAVQIDLDPQRIGLRYQVDVGLVGDSRRTLTELLPLLRRNPSRGFLEQAQASMAGWRKDMEEQGSQTSLPMKPQVVAWELGKRGLSAVVLERFHHVHTNGAHSGGTRVIRHAYAEGPDYVPHSGERRNHAG